MRSALKSGKILVVKLAGIGDFILALPALEALSSSRAEKLSILCAERVRGLAERSPCLQEVFFLREPFFSFTTLFRNLKTILLLRRKRFDLAINFHAIGSLRGLFIMKLLFVLLHAKARVLEVPVKKGKEIHEMAKYLEFLKMLDVTDVISAPSEISIPEADEREIAELLGERGLAAQEILVGLQPGGNKEKFLWPISHFSRIARHLHERYNAAILVTGNQKERALGEKLQVELDFPVHNFCGLIPLEKMPAFLRRIDLFVSNDTGLIHLAGAVGTPLIGLYGPFSEKRFYPVHRSGKCVVIHKQEVASMGELSSEEVIRAIDELLKR